MPKYFYYLDCQDKLNCVCPDWWRMLELFSGIQYNDFVCYLKK